MVWQMQKRKPRNKWKNVTPTDRKKIDLVRLNYGPTYSRRSSTLHFGVGCTSGEEDLLLYLEPEVTFRLLIRMEMEAKMGGGGRRRWLEDRMTWVGYD